MDITTRDRLRATLPVPELIEIAFLERDRDALDLQLYKLEKHPWINRHRIASNRLDWERITENIQFIIDLY